MYHREWVGESCINIQRKKKYVKQGICKVYMNRIPVKLQLAQTTIVSKETWKKIGTPKMKKNYCKAHGASGWKLKTKGVINCNVCFGGKTG